MREIIGSIDIGCDKIKLVVAEFFDNDFNILCALEGNTKGFRNYEIVDDAALIKSIRLVLEKASLKLNFKLKKIIANIPTTYNNFIVSEAVNSITNEDFRVTSNDILRVLQSTTYNKINASEELIGLVPIFFRVGDGETKEPFNKRGKSITARSVLITASKKNVYDILGILEKCGLEVIDIASTGLVDYYNFKNDYLDLKTGIIVNLGCAKTEISVISKGIYINNEVINLGGRNVDKDIAYIYNLKISDAKYIKENLALANIRRANPKETIKVVNKNNEEITINQYELTEIVASRMIEILKNVKNSINHLTKKEISYIIITGGLTEFKDFNISLTSIFGESASIGVINTLGARDNKFSTSIGMIKSFNEKLKLRHRTYSTVSDEDVENMCNKDSKVLIPSDSILGKIFGYFFDN
ncbi:MAG: cell division FtsA domain-containing protein [Bacilli bacterium]|nr:cell division FtsA domain-containing protein [Bacilli bacterium]